jgi:uncharacterized protein YjbI with pentapeptide repeats
MRGAAFLEASFSGEADFSGVTFSGGAHFSAHFYEATFGGDAHFGGATFGGRADFRATTFSGDAQFYWATFSGDADFQGATFEQASRLGPLLVCGGAFLDGAVFGQPVRIEVSSRILSCARAVFRGGADVFARWADVLLEDADFAAPSLVTELRPLDRSERERAFLGWEEAADDGTWLCRLGAPPDEAAPRVLSLRRAKVAQLTLAGVDLRACRFLRGHGLDELTLDRVRFANPPDGWQRVGRWSRLRWTRRQTIAEERHWREDHDPGSGWYEGEVRAPDWLPDTSQPPDAAQVSGVYRALRKGREDSKDEPGAADFYYGEMEMRRHAGASTGETDSVSHPALRADRWVLWLYWLVSGYGLRASRSLAVLATTIALLAVPLSLWGFIPDRPYGRALLFATESSISLLRAPEAKLTASGEVIQIVLRLAGPLFFGLALLSLRGRVKR